MEYIGIQTQISRNNFRSLLLILAFPAILFSLTWIFFYFIARDENGVVDTLIVNQAFLDAIPYILGFVMIWFLIAWLSHSAMIKRATSSEPLERKDNERVYNLVENLCISKGISVPRIFIINDDSLNAFASGISKQTYSISLSAGIINRLKDDELEAVIAHELSHIINRDVRLLIISIIFVGIFSFISEMAFRALRSGSGSKGKKGGAALLLIAVLGLIGYFLSILFRFAISRKREYLADASAAEMTKNPLALASALRKISNDPWIEAVKRDDVAQMFIEHPKKEEKSFFSFLSGFFQTHPPIEERIKVLENF